MDLLLTVIVFLLGVGLGVLVLHYLRRSRDADRIIEAAAQIAEDERKHRDADRIIEAAARIADDERRHRDAIATVQLKEVRTLGHALLREMKVAARERNRLMAFVEGDPDSAPVSSEGRTSAPDSEARPVTTPGASTLPPDAPTPQTGYSLTELLRPGQEQSS